MPHRANITLSPLNLVFLQDQAPKDTFLDRRTKSISYERHRRLAPLKNHNHPALEHLLRTTLAFSENLKHNATATVKTKR